MILLPTELAGGYLLAKHCPSIALPILQSRCMFRNKKLKKGANLLIGIGLMATTTLVCVAYPPALVPAMAVEMHNISRGIRLNYNRKQWLKEMLKTRAVQVCMEEFPSEVLDKNP